ncbi:MAG TPA: hypothetical protein VFI47_11085 [Acidimicrobiales bacterium]|nr:hypothetical protein [Acidimicrobiales bacterium]
MHELLTQLADRVDAAVTAFHDGAGGHGGGSDAGAGDPLRGVRDESDYLAGWVTSVAAAFRAAGGDPDGDGVWTAPDAALAGLLLSPVLAEERAAVAAELGTLAERARAGELDLTPAELAAVVERARRLVDGAPDPAAAAELLLTPLGAGDLDVAVSVLEHGAGDATGVEHPAVAALRNLGHVVSLGLESQPERAARWADEVVDRRARGPFDRAAGAAVEGLAVMAGGNAAGTSAFAAALYGQLVTRTGTTPADGLTARLYGVTAPGAPIMFTAGHRGADGRFDQPELAHALVDDLSAGGGAGLWRAMGHAAPDDMAATSRDVLVASVDPSLPVGDRRRLAYRLAGLYLDQPGPLGGDLPPYPPEVTSGFAAATRPLMEGWSGRGSRVIDLDPGGGGDRVGDARLWDAVRRYGEVPGGSGGLARALGGVTDHVLSDALAAGTGPGSVPGTATYPLDPNRLADLEEVYTEVSSTVANERFRSVVDALEDGGGAPTDAAFSIGGGMVGEIPGGSTAAGLVDAARTFDETREVSGGGDPTVGVEAQLVYRLVVLDVQARPDLVTPELAAELLDSARTGGRLGIYDLLRNTEGRYPPTDANGGEALTRLRDLVLTQLDRTGMGTAVALGEAADLGEGADDAPS